jgi:hypothetical protein
MFSNLFFHETPIKDVTVIQKCRMSHVDVPNGIRFQYASNPLPIRFQSASNPLPIRFQSLPIRFQWKRIGIKLLMEAD